MPKTKTIKVEVVGALTDPTEYKVMSPEFKFNNLFVEVDVESEKVGDSFVLKPAAFEELLAQLAELSVNGYEIYQEKRKSK